MQDLSDKVLNPVRAIRYQTMMISSPAFEPGGVIPNRYTCDGMNINPPLRVKGFPPEAKCLAIIMDDPDAPVGDWSHWVVWNIPLTHQIRSNHPMGEEGLNDFLRNRYDGPCPSLGRHRYYFKIYALDSLLALPGTTRKIALERAMAGKIIGYGELMGTYERKKSV